jgi:hypothetical protein
VFRFAGCISVSDPRSFSFLEVLSILGCVAVSYSLEGALVCCIQRSIHLLVNACQTDGHVVRRAAAVRFVVLGGRRRLKNPGE